MHLAVFLLLTLLLVTLLPNVAHATIDDVLTFTLNSDGESYSVTDCEPYASGLLTIPETYNGKPVTAIGNSAFYNCQSLTLVNIPDSVTSIGVSAFSNCPSLTSMTIPNSVTTIGTYAFNRCTNLTSVSIPNSVTAIGNYAFSGCSKLNAVHITDLASWCEIRFNGLSANPLYYAENLYINGVLATEITIPDSVTTIRNYAFYNCHNLTSVTIPDSVTSIGYGVFDDCYQLKYNRHDTGKYLGNTANPYLALIDVTSWSITSIQIHDHAQLIADKVFYGCSYLTSVTIPEGITFIGDYAFYSCRSLTSVTIPNSVSTIGYSAFEECKKLKSVTFGTGIQKIDRRAFKSCSALTSVILPEGVTFLGLSAFEDCIALKTVVLPNSLQTLEPYAFLSCRNLNYNIYDNGKYLGNSENPYLALIDTTADQILLPETVRVFASLSLEDTFVILPDSFPLADVPAFRDKHVTFASLTGHPLPVAVKPEQSAVFTVTADNQNFKYQWQYSKNDGETWYNSSSATKGYNTDTLTVVGTAARNNFLYRCKITNSYGVSVYSNAARLDVKEKITTVTMQPQDTSATTGENAVFTVAAEGNGLTYQWQISTGSSWSNLNNTGYNTTQVTILTRMALNGARIRCRITDADGDIYYSESAVLTVLDVPFAITVQPQSLATRHGNEVTFAIEATGDALDYLWQYSLDGEYWHYVGSSMGDYSKAVLTMTANRQWNGYFFRCRIKNGSNEILYSNSVILLVEKAILRITQQPQPVTAKIGDAVQFSVQAEGDGVTYRWYYSANKGDTWSAMATSADGYNKDTLTVVGTMSLNGYLYRCKLTDSDGNILYSEAAKLTVEKAAPEFTQQPKTTTVKQGAKTTFAITAEGEGLTYQWQYKTNPNGAWYNSSSYTTGYNTPSLTVVAEAKRNGFIYRCCVIDLDGNKYYSKTATLNVDIPALSAFAVQPQSQTALLGKNAVFSVTTQGDVTSIQWQYQTTPGKAWYDSSSATQGYNTAKLTVKAEEKRQGFAYRCVIVDSQGYIHISNEVVLTVVKAQFSIHPTDQTVKSGTKAIFFVAVQGTYQQVYWQYSTNGGKSWNASSSSFTGYNTTAMTVEATAARNGFLYRCVLIDADGNRFESAAAKLIVQ